MTKILIIDDDDSITALLKAKIEAAGNYDVDTTDSGNIGWLVALHHSPDVIVLDFMLPDIDGDAILEKLQAEPSTANIPVLCLTSLATADADGYKQMSGKNCWMMTKATSPKNIVDRIIELANL